MINFLYKKRVFLGFLFGFAYLIFAKPASLGMLISGITLGVVGETIRLIASGYIIKTDELATYGPYAYIRHPLYLGSFIMGLGMCLALFSSFFPLHAFIFTATYLVFFFSVYIPVLKKEEAVLIEKYQDEYLNYKSTVPMLFPLQLKKYASKTAKKFDKKTFLNNKEYQALSGLLLIIAILIIKYNMVIV
ncbi:MAG: isoprenylcysteine carboxylmethyltransferase family protein [bacterium]|nr:isoprenylcysteine carboxylmethyltransferase family protein [bacterium]